MNRVGIVSANAAEAGRVRMRSLPTAGSVSTGFTSLTSRVADDGVRGSVVSASATSIISLISLSLASLLGLLLLSHPVALGRRAAGERTYDERVTLG